MSLHLSRAFLASIKKKKWAGFFAFTIPAGGGELKYKNGNARTVALASGVAANANAAVGWERCAGLVFL